MNIENNGKYVLADEKCYCKIVDGKRAEKYPWEEDGEKLKRYAEIDLDKNDGTLHISVSKGQLAKIGRVLVTEDGTTFCKLFY